MSDLLFKLKEYIIYVYKAKDEYSIHSPLVFDFYTKAIKHKKSSVCQRTTDYFTKTCIEKSNDFDFIDSSLKQEDKNIVIIIENIHSNKNNSALWKSICEINSNFASLDFFSTGVLIKDTRLIKRNHSILWK